MAQTNYRVYKWLINLLYEHTDETHFLTLEDINKFYERDLEKIYNFDAGDVKARNPLRKKDVQLKHDKVSARIIRTTFINWRKSIYAHFGLKIRPAGIKGAPRGSIFLENGEELNRNQKLQDFIDYLADGEERSYEENMKDILFPRGRKSSGKSTAKADGSMGFIMTGGNMDTDENPQFGYQEEPEMVGIIRFLMTIGEAMVIKTIGGNSIFEPQDLKCINGRWYVSGNQYPYSEETQESSLVIYDTADIKISDDEDIEAPLYKLINGFDLTHLIPWDWKKHFENENEVISLYLEVYGPRFEKQPFCPTQVLVLKTSDAMPRYTYKIYVKPNRDFILQYLASGRNVKVINPHDKIPRTPTDISDEQIEYLRGLKRHI